MVTLPLLKCACGKNADVSWKGVLYCSKHALAKVELQRRAEEAALK